METDHEHKKSSVAVGCPSQSVRITIHKLDSINDTTDHDRIWLGRQMYVLDVLGDSFALHKVINMHSCVV